MKTLKTKRVNILTCWNGLRNVPPKNFSNIEEMEKTLVILDIFKESIPELTKILLEGDKMNMDIQLGKVKPEEIATVRGAFQKKANGIENATGDKEIDVSFEDDIFNTFFQLFEKLGVNWFMKLEGFISFRKDLNSTNQQPKNPKNPNK